MHPNSAKIEITQPRLFNASAVAMVNAYGLALVAPIVVSILAVSLIRFGFLTVLIPLLTLAATAYCLPLGLGNTYICQLVRSGNPAAAQAKDGFIVQLTLSPRIRSGLRAKLEDADDIGYLSFNESGFRFEGDSVKLAVPFDQIRLVQPQNIGLRGLFVYGQRIKVVVAGLGEIESVEFAERCSRLLPASRSISRALEEHLSGKAAPEARQGKASIS
jgi:hypothetical protein